MKRLPLFLVAMLLAACNADYPVSSEAARQIDAVMARCDAQQQNGQRITATAVADCRQRDAAAVLENYPGEKPNLDLWQAYWRQDRAIAAAQDSGQLQQAEAEKARQDNLGSLRQAVRRRDFRSSGGRNLQPEPDAVASDVGCSTQTPYAKTVYTDCH